MQKRMWELKNLYTKYDPGKKKKAKKEENEAKLKLLPDKINIFSLQKIKARYTFDDSHVLLTFDLKSPAYMWTFIYMQLSYRKSEWKVKFLEKSHEHNIWIHINGCKF